MCSVIIVKPMDSPEYIELKSDRVDFLQITSITANELDFAKEYGSITLAKKLVDKFGDYVVELSRDSLEV